MGGDACSIGFAWGSIGFDACFMGSVADRAGNESMPRVAVAVAVAVAVGVAVAGRGSRYDGV